VQIEGKTFSFKDGSMYYSTASPKTVVPIGIGILTVIMMDMRQVIGKAENQCFANKLQMVQPNCGK